MVTLLSACILISKSEVVDRLDLDGDGVGWPDDCDDRDASAYPGAPDSCGDGTDADCDGEDCLTRGGGTTRTGDGDFGHDVAVLAGGVVLVGAPSENLAYADSVVLIGQPSCGNGGDGAGWSVAPLTDRDGDGLDEALIGAPGTAGGEFCTGNVFLSASATWGEDGVDLVAAEAVLAGFEEQGAFGHALSSGDVDGDGLADVAVGAPAAGLAYLFPGDALDGAVSAEAAVAVWSEEGAGLAVSIAGDATGDGYEDTLVATATGTVLLSAATWAEEARIDGLGGCGPRCVAGLGDRDDDDRSEVVLADSGNVYVFSGSALDGAVEATATASSILTGSEPLSLAAAGDTDQDGLPDLIIGMAGAVYLVTQPGRGLNEIAALSAWSVSDASIGSAVAGGVDLGLGASGPDIAVGDPAHATVRLYAGRND